MDSNQQVNKKTVREIHLLDELAIIEEEIRLLNLSTSQDTEMLKRFEKRASEIRGLLHNIQKAYKNNASRL